MEAFSAGANDYLVKPPDPVEVVARVRYHSEAYSNWKNRAKAEDALQQSNRRLAELVDQLEGEIAERKRTEQELVSAREAALESSRLKSEFLANMSHELRTPLNAIIGMTELLLDAKVDPDQLDCLNAVKISADSLLALISDILDFSKIEAGKLDLFVRDFPLRDSISDTLNTFALRAHQKGIELACHVFADVPDALLGDVDRLRQIVVNIVGNAVKFTERGEIVVEVQVEPRTDDIQLHFTVRDTGVGIAAEKQQTIFDSFNQADGSTTRQYGGTGLGLAISSKLVEMMGGKCWVESELGKGSCFHFTACFGRGEETSPPALADSIADLAGLNVLVVDDNATNRRILRDMLANWRMRTVAVEDAGSALTAFHKANRDGDPFDLILSDVNMP
ncbi:MAG: ATP-binding protein, partial [Planctomycetales bacterium]